jgi:ATP-dependent helicase HrpB
VDRAHKLPIDEILADIHDALSEGSSAVVLATPGAGKTTRIPLYLKDTEWLSGKTIVMLEPRRLAARMAATYMAKSLGEDVGQTVGYRVRHESRISKKTKIEVVTEGILTRRLQKDPDLSGVGLLVFDEFHERSLEADLGLALALDVQSALRPDLKILVMSATLDDKAVAELLGGAPVITCEHRPHDVVTRYAAPHTGTDLVQGMAALIRRALAEEEGSILAFLPGESEIRRTAASLSGDGLPPNVKLAPLFGALLPAEQQAAIAPPIDGMRKVVLATTIAETSLTIEGVRIVVDCGFKRTPLFDSGRGMTRLVTTRVSQAAAEQRRGRAGRLGPGVCYRMWPEPETRGLAAFDSPEMMQTDLAPLTLDLAAWGASDPDHLSWMTPPPAGAFSQATELLRRLNAIDQTGGITREGRRMADFPLHPRLAHMVLRGGGIGIGSLACDLAALLSERDILLGSRDPDMRSRLEILRGERAEARTRVNRNALARVKAAAKQIRGTVQFTSDAVSLDHAGKLLALAYPDRVAHQRSAGRYRLSGGGGAFLDPADPLASHDFLAVAELGSGSGDARIFLAAPLALEDLEDAFTDDITEQDQVGWDKREEAVAAQRQRKLGALVLSERPLRDPDPDLVLSAMQSGIRELGLDVLPWTPALRALQCRVALLRGVFAEDQWPDLSDTALLENLGDWLGPYLSGITRRGHLTRIDLGTAIRALLPWDLSARLDEQAPTHIAVPSGSRIRVDYGTDGDPAVHVKLQEVFGQSDTPTIASGRVPVTLHLLSPARRSVAVTQDLGSFWKSAYPDVRREMRGRYPRHIWPENPMEAAPTRRSVKPRGKN